ncbi:MAG: hypothetical protein IT184_18715 [Acidobacteria bacterium]|nr:hypothetical protein [Acidobacteriota bacterium]
MNDQELRALVRDLVTRRLAERTSRPPDVREPAEAAVHVGPADRAGHPSQDVYITLVNTGDACVIEPGASCNHCNYCRSHGH